MHNFLYDPMNYRSTARRGCQSKLSAGCKGRVIRMAIQDCVYSTTIKSALEISVKSRTVINV